MARLGFGFGFGLGAGRAGGEISPPAPPLSAIAADGWQAVVASPTELSLTPFSVSRGGYDATGAAVVVAATLRLGKRVREPYPDQAVLTADRVAITDYIYATDTIAGATNNSALVSPQPIANWASPARAVVGNSLPVEVVAFHRDGVACVIFTASDGTNSVSATVSAMSVSGRAGDCHAVLVYAAAIDITGLDAGLVTVNASVYPVVGGAASVLASSASAVPREFSPRYFLKNVALAAAPPFAYVSASGVDASGVVSTNAATAAAAPFLTILGAMAAIVTALGKVDGAVIRVGAGSFVLGSDWHNRPQNVGWLTITRDPAASRSAAVVTFGASGFRPNLTGAFTAPVASQAVRLHDITVQRSGATALYGESAAHLEMIFDDVDFDFNGYTGAWVATTAHDYIYGMTAVNAAGTALTAAGNGEHRILRGLDCNNAAAMDFESWLILGSTLRRVSSIVDATTRASSRSIVAFNSLFGATSAKVLTTWAKLEAVDGAALVQNIIEFVGPTDSPMLSISADSSAYGTSHFLIWNNSFAGYNKYGRCNIFYDEGPTPRTNTLQSVQGNIMVQWNTKGDVFRGVGEGGGDASTRLGNFAIEHGVGAAGNLAQFANASGDGGDGWFAPAYHGPDSLIGTSNVTPIDPLFTAPAHTTAGPVAGAGGGTYSIGALSPAKALVPVRRLPFDIAGNARPATGDSAGAFV